MITLLEKTREKLYIGLGNDFLNITQKTHTKNPGIESKMVVCQGILAGEEMEYCLMVMEFHFYKMKAIWKFVVQQCKVCLILLKCTLKMVNTLNSMCVLLQLKM